MDTELLFMPPVSQYCARKQTKKDRKTWFFPFLAHCLAQTEIDIHIHKSQYKGKRGVP